MLRSLVAMQYLLAWNPQLNERDEQGLTPLHLAVKSVRTLNSTRPVRALLMRGAQRSLQDNQGRRPIDLAVLSQPSPCYEELRKMLMEPSCWSCLMLNTPLKNVERSPSLMITYFVLLAIIYAASFLLLRPSMLIWSLMRLVKFREIWFYIVTGCTALSLFFHLISACLDPGYLREPRRTEPCFLTGDPNNYCPDCEVTRRERS